MTVSGPNFVLYLKFFFLKAIGMGLPTTANYIVVSALMAPVLMAIAEQNGLVLPLIAVHLFVFYFGILADDTPPVGLAAYAAAAISRGDPIRTGIQGFTYDIRTAVLPFMFIFNTQLLLIGIEHWWQLLFTVTSAAAALLIFAAATQGFFLVKSRLWETIVLLLIAFTLFRPGFWMDRLYLPLETIAPARITEVAEAKPEDAEMRVVVEGETLEGNLVSKSVLLPLGPKASGEERLESTGLVLRKEDDKVFVEDVLWNSVAYQAGIEFDWEIKAVEVAMEQPAKYWMYLPALLALAGIMLLQRRRQKSV